MKRLFLLCILSCFCVLSFAQDNLTGIIIYEQIIDYNLEGVYDDSAWDDYIADLPKNGKISYQLSFSDKASLYQKNPDPQLSEHLSTAIKKANWGKPERELLQLYLNLEDQTQIEQIQFMTRLFLLESTTPVPSWKLTTKRKRVLDYVCMGAELELGEETLTAWFTPEIPVSAGPGSYFGLPGIILGLEKKEEVFLMAKEIKLEEVEIEMPKKGQKEKAENFEKIAAEKLLEYQKMINSKMGSKDKKN